MQRRHMLLTGCCAAAFLISFCADYMTRAVTFPRVAVAGLAFAGFIATLQRSLSNGHDEHGTKHASAVLPILR